MSKEPLYHAAPAGLGRSSVEVNIPGKEAAMHDNLQSNHGSQDYLHSNLGSQDYLQSNLGSQGWRARRRKRRRCTRA